MKIKKEPTDFDAEKLLERVTAFADGTAKVTRRVRKISEPTVLTKDQIAESIINSITDHDVGWASVSTVASKGSKTEFVLKSGQWNTADQSFKVTIEEIK